MFKKNLLPLIITAVGAVLVLLSFAGTGNPSADDLKLNIKPANYIMPAAYKVYANPEVLGGRYNLFKAALKNESRQTVKNLKVEYRIPKYIDSWTEASAPKYVLPGQTIVALAYPAFDQNITQKNSQSREKTEIRITFGDKEKPQEIDESFSFTMMAAEDFAYTDMPASEIVSMDDMFENYPLAACFITAEDPVIQYYTSRIQQKLLQGETAGVTNSEEQGVRFMMGIYEATRRSGMVYSSTAGVPSNTGDVQTIVQRIRLPRDVVTGNTGLCIELSFLYASVMRNAGMNAMVYFMPGHAFPGFQLNGNYYAIEATGINGEGIGGVYSAEEAYKAGMQKLTDGFQAVRQGKSGYELVDVNEFYRMGIIPMELRDDNFARQKIDEYASLWNSRTAASNENLAQSGGGSSGGGGGGSSSGGGGSSTSGLADYSRGVSFSYPAGWKVVNNPYPQIPPMRSAIASPQGYLEVYQIDGTANVWDGLGTLVQLYGSMGMTITYQKSGSYNGYSLVTGVTVNASGQRAGWFGAFRAKGNSVGGLVIPAGVSQAQQILSSLK